jgi:hypothetical protein
MTDEAMPTRDAYRARAQHALDQFLTLTADGEATARQWKKHNLERIAAQIETLSPGDIFRVSLLIANLATARPRKEKSK